MIKINPEFQNCIPSLSKDEFNLLKENIKKEGIREPLIIWKDFIVDGHNRYNICKELKIDFEIKEKEFENKEEVLIWIINNQLGRRNISSYDRIKLALLKEEYFQKKAKENQKLSDGKGVKKSSNLKVKSINTREEISKIAEASHDTIKKVKLIEQNATKEQKQRLSEQKDSINYIYNEVKKDLNKVKGKQEVEMPKESFDIIYADPPWLYSFMKSTQRSIEKNYPTMNLEQIKNMKIPSKENSVLFLWATAPKLKEAIEVMDKWGYEYKTCAVWDKEIIGMGYWFRGQHELLLVGTKGQVKTPDPNLRISSMFREKRGKHSQKPEYFYEMIEKMFPNKSYIELFSRKKRKNWISWGNEI